MADRPRRSGFAAFVLVALSVWTGLNAYVGARLMSLPVIAERPPLPLAVGLLVGALAVAFPLGHIAARDERRRWAKVLDAAGSLWVGTAFLFLVCLLAADLVSGFGYLLPGLAPRIDTAAAILALLLAMVSVVQGMRPPAVREESVALAGLPEALAGTRIVQLSDLHLGPVLGARWMRRVASHVATLDPHILALTGDLLDRVPETGSELWHELRRLEAPLGVFAVTGNHEYYAGLESCLACFRGLGWNVLRDQRIDAAPGLRIAGIDDLTARRGFGLTATQDGADDPMRMALAGIGAQSAAVLLSHTPAHAARAAELGAGLMLSGHTHGGQIWPFGYLVARAFPDAADRRAFGALTLIVSRGTGTWGPRMRLFRRAEIVLVTLT